MKVISVRNVHEALPRGLQLLDDIGVRRESRNGPVIMVPGPVTTVYSNPCERVMFWPQRDANPAFHLYEMLWMISGRRDIKPLTRYAKQMLAYSDDGEILHAAYGYRWRVDLLPGVQDQLKWIVERLKANPEDRRCVLQIWDAERDLNYNSKDLPCNLTCTFQRDREGRLDMAVFNRSNDIIWGAYGANAVHFSFLQEYMALWIGCPVGTYTQISVNYHAYAEKFEELKSLPRPGGAQDISQGWNPYSNVWDNTPAKPTLLEGSIEQVDRWIGHLLQDADTEYNSIPATFSKEPEWCQIFYRVLKSHNEWRTRATPERFQHALMALQHVNQQADWIVAMREWLLRRQAIWQGKMDNGLS